MYERTLLSASLMFVSITIRQPGFSCTNKGAVVWNLTRIGWHIQDKGQSLEAVESAQTGEQFYSAWPCSTSKGCEHQVRQIRCPVLIDV